MIKLFLIALLIVTLAMVGLAFNILFRKNGRFPAYSVGHNAEMRKRGITCVKCEELNNFKKKQPGNSINPLDLKVSR